MTAARISINDFVSINGQTVGVLKSRKGRHINSPSARKGQTTVFYEVDTVNKSYGTAHEIEMPALITANMTSTVNPDVIKEIEKIIK